MMKPMFDYVLVRRVDEKDPTTATGIVLPVSDGALTTGTVVAVGRGFRTADGVLVPPTIHVGARVVFDRRHVTDLRVNGEQLIAIHESQIIAYED